MDINTIAAMCTTHQDEGIMIPKCKTRTRVQQLDTDAACYALAKPEMSLEENKKRMFHYINGLRGKADCEYTYSHTTVGLKGGREYVATYQPYQGKRQHGDEQYKHRVREIREAVSYFQAPWLKPLPQQFVEADDSMTQLQRQIIESTGDMFSSVISTNDKDLNMAMGVVQNINSGLFTVQGNYTANGWTDCYGKTTYDADKGKLVGRGESFFWHQMLAGDPVDHIKGLPMVMPEIANIIDPIRKPAGRKPKSIAYGSVCKYLADCKDSKTAARRVRMMYKYWEAANNYPTLFEETALLLWMQRTPSVLDVYDYFNECGIPIKPSPIVMDKLHNYMAEVTRRINGVHV